MYECGYMYVYVHVTKVDKHVVIKYLYLEAGMPIFFKVHPLFLKPYIVFVVYSLNIIRFTFHEIDIRFKFLQYFKRFAHILMMQPLRINTIYIYCRWDIDLLSSSISGSYSCLLPQYRNIIQQKFLVRLINCHINNLVAKPWWAILSVDGQLSKKPRTMTSRDKGTESSMGMNIIAKLNMFTSSDTGPRRWWIFEHFTDGEWHSLAFDKAIIYGWRL